MEGQNQQQGGGMGGMAQQGMKFGGLGQQQRGMGMDGGSSSRSAETLVSQHARREKREKMRFYRRKHERAKEVFERIVGTPVETKADAIAAYARALRYGTPEEVAQLQFASGDFCWACNEKEAEQETGGDEQDYED